VADVFGLSYAQIGCNGSTSVEDFVNGILVDAGPNEDMESPERNDGLQLHEVGLRSYSLFMIVTGSLLSLCPLRRYNLYSCSR
jgi:hypothetical protein